MSRRPPNPKKLSLADLKPGDVLLSGGDSDIDKIIMMLDEGDYSHATQYIGIENNTHMVVEATTHGIKYETIDVDVNAQNLIDVYRYVSDDGNHLGDQDWPVAPILTQAKSFVGGAYAYSDLLLVAVALMASELPTDSTEREFLRLALMQIQHEIVKWLDENSDKTPMTCVQVVSSSYYQAQATPANKYGIDAIINGARKNPFTASTPEVYDALKSNLIDTINDLHDNSGMRRTIGSAFLPLGSCTPRDLAYSPNLTFVGCLKDTRHAKNAAKKWFKFGR